ncbi:RTX toxin, partial [Rhizobium leguminosarum]
GHARVVGTVDVGAYESSSSAAPGTPTTPTQPGTPTTPTQPGTPTTPTKEFVGTNGNDIMPHTGQSNGGNETFKGLGGSDVLKGGAGADVLDGGTGNDTASYAGSTAVNVNLATGAATGGHATGDKFVSIENLTGSSYNDVLTGNSGSNVLDGGAGADKLNGGLGNDKLFGKAGADILTGGGGGDTFVFNVKPDNISVDHIRDFSSAAGDKLMLDHSIFAALSLSGFSDENFVLGTKALEADDKLIYDQKSGILSYDADGSAAGAAVHIADLDNSAALHFKDFLLV